MFKFLLILSSIFAMSAKLIDADGDTTRFQRQQFHEMRAEAYPAAGYRPNRRFNLPNEPQPQSPQPQSQPQPQPATANDEYPQQIQPRRPDLTYGIPPAARFQLQQQPQQQQQQQLQQQEQQQQFFYQTQNSQPARLIASNVMKSAQLAVNSEAGQDDEPDAEIATDIEVQNKMGNAPPTAAVQPTTIYYPAGAVSFVQPLAGSFAQPVPQPQPAATVATVQPAPVAAPVAATPIASPVLSSAAYIQPFQYAKLQAQPFPLEIQPNFVKTARIETQNVYASPAALTAPIAFPNAQARFTAAPAAQLQAAPVNFNAAYASTPYTFAVNPTLAAAPAKLELQPASQVAQVGMQPVANFFSATSAYASPAVSAYATPAALTAAPAYATPAALAAAPAYASPARLTAAPAYATPAALAAAPAYASPAALTSAPAYATPAALTAAPAYATPAALTAAPAYASPARLTAHPTATTTIANTPASFVQPQYYVSAPAQLQAW